MGDIGDWVLYPTKGFAMHKRSREKKNLDRFIKEILRGDK